MSVAHETSLTALAADPRAFRRLPELRDAPSPFRFALRVIARNWMVGRLTFVLPSGRELPLEGREPGPHGRLLVRDFRFMRRVLAAGDIGFAEGYMAGEWETPDLSALLTALVLSGQPSDRFLFAGFLPAKQGQRRKVIAELKDIPATLILYEAPHRLAESLNDLAEGLGDRSACVCRELTKLYEEVLRRNLKELAYHYNQTGAPKGEIVIVIAPPEEASSNLNDIENLLRTALETLSVRDAAETVAKASGRPKREIYNQALALSAESRKP